MWHMMENTCGAEELIFSAISRVRSACEGREFIKATDYNYT